MDCKTLKKKIHRQAEEIVAGQLDDETKEHLKTCPECSRLVHQFQRAWLALESREQIESSPHWRIRLRQAINTESNRSPVWVWSDRPMRVLRPALAVCFVLIAVMVGQYLGGLSVPANDSDSQDTEITTSLQESSGDYYFDVFNAIPEGSMEDSYLSLALDS